jgi:hypothetical protein
MKSTQDEIDFRTPEEIKADELRKRSDALLLAVTSDRLTTTEERVAWILNKFPNTRDSDITLFITYLKAFHSELIQDEHVKLTDLYGLPRAGSITRLRARIQNDFRLFMASDPVRKTRNQLSEEEKQRALKVRQEIDYSVSVYGDESGKTSSRLIVGSVWFLRPFEMITVKNDLEAFQQERLQGKEIHFSSMNRKYEGPSQRRQVLNRDNPECGDVRASGANEFGG